MIKHIMLIIKHCVKVFSPFLIPNEIPPYLGDFGDLSPNQFRNLYYIHKLYFIIYSRICIILKIRSLNVWDPNAELVAYIQDHPLIDFNDDNKV